MNHLEGLQACKLLRVELCGLLIQLGGFLKGLHKGLVVTNPEVTILDRQLRRTSGWFPGRFSRGSL